MEIQDIFQAVLQFDEKEVVNLVKNELANDTNVETILNDGLISAMDEIGQQFSDGTIFVPEMLMAAHTMKAGLEVLRPFLKTANTKPKGTIIAGTVKGDLHDIGKNLVTMMLEGAGFKVIDLGVDVAAEKFLAEVQNSKADIVALSALLTTTMPNMEQTVKAFIESGNQIKTMVGGAPVTQSFADKIGSNGYAEDAPSAVALARKLIG